MLKVALEANTLAGILIMKNVIQQGVVQDFEDFEAIFHHACAELEVSPEGFVHRPPPQFDILVSKSQL